MKNFKTLYATFYSYKGGVGRTSALINSALLRAISGDRVVVIDFDLEAPGIWSYVREIAEAKGVKIDLENRPGVLEYLYESTNGETVPSLRKNAVTNEDLGLNIDGKIWFLGAGNTSDVEYSKKLGSLNWSEIFEKKYGEIVLENFKKQLINEFEGPDYVFIDSRTGITEVGGICTRYLADLVVTLSSLNDQNLLGTSKIVGAFKKAKIPTILVASNVPVGLPWGDNQLFYDRISHFKKLFSSKPDLLIYHYPSLSLKESLPALFKTFKEDAVLKEDPLLKSYENLSDRIDADNPYSFEKFLKQEIVHKILAYDEKKDGDISEALQFMEKYYSNKRTILGLLKSLAFVIKRIKSSDPAELLEEQAIKSLEEIKKFKKKTLPELSFLRDFALDRSSSDIVGYLEENRSSLGGSKSWYSILTRNSKIRALELLNEHGEYSFVYEQLNKDNLKNFFAFAKAFAAEKLGHNEEAKKMYKDFVKEERDPSDIDNPGAAFAYAFAYSRISDYEQAHNFAKRAEVTADFKDVDEPFFFIPMIFKRTQDKSEFVSNLDIFMAAILKNLNGVSVD